MNADTIVVGYADSAASRSALVVAADLARDLGTGLHVIHVVDLHDYPVDPDAADWEEAGVAHLEQERAEVERLLAGWPGEWRYELARGDAVRTLTEYAVREHARMIVVGTRGSSGFGAALERLLGAAPSIAHGLERAGIPVLVVPGVRRGSQEPRSPR